MSSLPPPPSALDPQQLVTRITQWASHTGELPQCTEPPLKSSPITSLPAELLGEIFLFSLPTERFPSPSPRTAPLSLTHVCRRWRQLAWSVPELWTALHLDYRAAVQDVRPTHEWLSHSGDKPLSLSLSIDFDERPHQAIINVLAQHSNRWKHVRFEFRSLQCPKMYDLTMATGSVPMLSSFEFHARDIGTLNIEPITALLSTATNLSELTWVDDLADNNTLLSLPLSRLSRFSLSMERGSLDYLQLLNICSNLEHIQLTRPFPEIRSPQSPLVLTKLASLNIAHDLTEVLDGLILPSLKHVRVHMDSGVPEHMSGRYSRALLGMSASGSFSNHTQRKLCWNPSSLLDLVERSSCAIESLWIHAPMQESDLAKCLKATSASLESLTIAGGLTLTDKIIQSLTPGRSLTTLSSASILEDGAYEWNCLCPSLSELILDTTLPNVSSLVELTRARLGISHSVVATSALLPLSISSFKCLKVHYFSGHRDIAYLRELAFIANSRALGSFNLSIVESRTGNMRGSSAGRTRALMYRRKVSASR